MLLNILLLAVQADGIRISHQRLDCLVKDRFPRIEAAIESADELAGARVYFKTPRETDFYFVEMSLVRGHFEARLPKPKETLVLYYIEAFGSTGPARRTPHMSAQVVKDPKACPRVGGVVEEGPQPDVRIFSTTSSTDKPRGFAGVWGVEHASAADKSGHAATSQALLDETNARPTNAPAPAPGVPPTAPSAEEPQAKPAADGPEAKPAPRDQGDQIGPEDMLRVSVYGHDDLAQVVVVQADGSFTYPLIGRVKAADLTPAELEQAMALRLSKGFVRNPQVTVVVQEYRSRNVFVVGEVAHPGAHPLTGRMTVMEMLAKAAPTAGAGAEVIIVRPLTEVMGPLLPDEVVREGGNASGSKPRAQVIRVSISDIQMGRLEKNLVLRPNDTLFVSQAPPFYVSGEVRNPGAFPFTAGLTFRQAIGMAGGFSPDASSSLRVVRKVNGKSVGVKVKLDDPAQPGDTIIVKAKIF